MRPATFSLTKSTLLVGFLMMPVPLLLVAQSRTRAPMGSLSPADTGNEVRAWRKDRYASPRFVLGTLQGLTRDSMAIKSRRSGTLVLLALDSVSKMEISTGRESPLRNMMIGAMVGAPLLIPAGRAIAGAFEIPCRTRSCNDVRIPVVIVSAIAGASLGGAVGALFPGRTTWQQVGVR